MYLRWNTVSSFSLSHLRTSFLKSQSITLRTSSVIVRSEERGGSLTREMSSRMVMGEQWPKVRCSRGRGSERKLLKRGWVGMKPPMENSTREVKREKEIWRFDDHPSKRMERERRNWGFSTAAKTVPMLSASASSIRASEVRLGQAVRREGGSRAPKRGFVVAGTAGEGSFRVNEGEGVKWGGE